MSNNLTLTQIWNQSTGIYKEGSLVFLRVLNPELPMSYLTNDPWLAAQSRIQDHENAWSVGLRPYYLARVHGSDRKAAQAILARMKDIQPYLPGYPVRLPVEWAQVIDEPVFVAPSVKEGLEKPAP